MRNNPSTEYAVKRRFSGDTNGLSMRIPIEGIIAQQSQQGAGQPFRVNPEYYGEQHSARNTNEKPASQEHTKAPLSFRGQDKTVEQPVLGFSTKKTPLSGATLNVPVFKPKYRKASHDFVNDPTTNMTASEIFVRPAEKAKESTPRAPALQLGGLDGMARKVSGPEDNQDHSPLMKFKHTMLEHSKNQQDLSKSAILGLGNNDWKENANNGPAKGVSKLNNLDFFRHKPVVIPVNDGATGYPNNGSPLLTSGSQQKGPVLGLPAVQPEQHSPTKIDAFKRRIVVQPQQNPPVHQALSQESQGSSPGTGSPLKQALSFKRAEMRSNPSIPSPEVSSPNRVRQPPPKIDDFVLGKKLGKGRFGDVFVVKHKHIGFICAMKVISKQVVRQQKFEEQLTRELKLQSYMKHPNIAALYGCFDDLENIYLLVELCADSHLQKKLKEEKRLPEDRAVDILRQICNGMDFMHREGVLHRDIKPENVVMHEVLLKLTQGMAKICDFGWAIHAGTGLRQTFCGTPLYVSPELLLGEQYDNSVDAWAVGVLAYEMLIGRTPFKVMSADDLGKIVRLRLIQITDDLVFPSYVELSIQSKDFLTRALEKDPAKRMDLDEMLGHPFLKEHKKEQPQFEFKL